MRFVLSFCLFVFPLMVKAEWDGNPICWWLDLYFCFLCCWDVASCTGCYWWLSDAGSCIQAVSFVWVLTIWYSLGLVHPLQCSCLESPRDGGAWWAAIYGVAQSRTQLKWLSSSSSRVSSRSRVLASVLLLQRLGAWSLVRKEDSTSGLLWY